MFLRERILYEDKYFLIYDKEPKVNSLAISPLICHRLDKETSGILIIAKNQKIKEEIQKQFKNKTIKKEYIALVLGKFDLIAERRVIVEGFIIRDKKNYQKRKFIPAFQIKNFSITGRKNERYSKTKILPQQIFEKQIFKKANQKDLNYFSLIKAYPETGRTHQIRLHLASIHHPVLGDNLYGGKIMKKISYILKIKRGLLHAYAIKMVHPITNKVMSFQSEIPMDFQKIIKNLQKVENER